MSIKKKITQVIIELDNKATRQAVIMLTYHRVTFNFHSPEKGVNVFVLNGEDNIKAGYTILKDAAAWAERKAA